ncbi:MAG: protein kinase [Bryobacteraceae bacterium]
MTDEQWRLVWQTYRRALTLPEAERSAFASEQEPQVAAHVLRLLSEPESISSSGSSGGSVADEQRLSPGDTIGRYRITGLLGQGGMGDVFAGEDTELDRKVALKVLRSTGGRENAGAEGSFFREARAASALNHPNIVTVHEVIRGERGMAIAMELVQGDSLRALCAAPQPVTQVSRIGRQIAAALAAAHDAGLVHRDVKPENAMVRADGYVKVLDFGLARRFEGISAETDGIPAGTLRYMSPEQTAGGAVDPASDVFALGLVLYEMAAGQHPFARDSALETMLAIHAAEPVPLRQMVPSVPRALEELIGRMLSKDPAQRPAAPIVAAELEALERADRDPVPAAPALTSSPANGPWMRAAGAAAVAVSLALGWMLLAKRDSPTGDPVEAAPFTTETGTEGEPAVSPDGRRVAYESSQGEGQHIYIKDVDGGASVRLTAGKNDESSPAWSPDGRSIAFLRRSVEGVRTFELIVRPVDSGPEHRVAILRTVYERALTWSPDSRAVVAATNEVSEGRIALYAIPVAGGPWRRLTDPPAQADPFGDRTPAFSPDGTKLAFSRSLAFASSDVFTVPVSAQLEPQGEPVRVLTGKEYTTHPAWLPGGRELLVSAGTQQDRRLFRASIKPGAKALVLAGAGEGGHSPVITRNPQTGAAALVYARKVRSANLYWRPMAQAGPTLRIFQPPAPRRLAASSSMNEHPHVSADGKRVAFVSDRTGSTQVWSVDVESGAATQWTSMNCPTVAVPRWSFDGRRITFTANCGKQTDVYVVDGPGRPPLRLTDSPALDENSTFSPDGRWIYFTSHRDGGQRIWRVAANGGAAEPVTTQVSSLAAFSANSGTLYFTGRWKEKISLWSMPAEGGEAKLLVDSASYFLPLEQGLLYSVLSSRHLMFYRFDTRASQPLATVVDRDYVFSAPPDGSALVTSQHEVDVTDLMIVRNFR